MKTHNVDELRLLYKENPESIKQRVKPGDKIYTDNDWLKELLIILKKCGLKYTLDSQNITSKGFHAITILGETETKN